MTVVTCKNYPDPGANPDVEKDTNAVPLRELPPPEPKLACERPPVHSSLVPHALSLQFSSPAGFPLGPVPRLVHERSYWLNESAGPGDTERSAEERPSRNLISKSKG